MKTVRSSNPRLASVVPYDPKYLPAEEYLSANENPRNLPEEIQAKLASALKTFSFNRYPDPLANELRTLIAQEKGLSAKNVLLGNGGDELLFNIALAWGGPGRKFMNFPPTFSVYEANAYLTGTETVNVPRTETFQIDEEATLGRLAHHDIDYLIITSPNNPTGNIVDEAFLERLLSTTDALVMVDEAYCEFSGSTVLHFLGNHKNLVLLRTFSKAYALAGIRLGYLLADEEVIQEFIKVRQPYSVDALSQLIGCEVCRNRKLLVSGIHDIINQRAVVLERLRQMPGVTAFDSQANYILLKVDNAHEVWEKLYEHGVLVRDFSQSAYLQNCLRVSIGTEEENRVFLSKLEAILNER